MNSTKQYPVALAFWKDKTDLFDRIGAGKDYTERNATSATIHLNFRAVEHDDPAKMATWYGVDGQPTSDICLYVWFDNNGAFNMEFNAHAIGFASQRKVEGIFKLMKLWNTRAEKAYEVRKRLTDTRESFGDCLRRMIAATGAKTALGISEWRGGPEREYSSIDIAEAVAKYVMPAVCQVRAKLKDADPVQQAA